MAALKTLWLVVCLLLRPAAPQCLTKDDSGLKYTETGRLDLINSQLQFSTGLFQSVAKLFPKDNVFFSPASVFNTLLLAYFSASNQTETALQKTLKIPENHTKLDTLGAYSLEKYNQAMRSVKGAESYRLSSANRMYVSTEHKVRPCIQQLLPAEIESADFKHNLTGTVEDINTWVAGETRNNIKDLLSPDSLNANTNLVLVNAAYFRGFWKYQFSPSETQDSEFILANGSTVPVQVMSLEAKFSHRIDEVLGVEVLELPYLGGDISMYILLPLSPSESAVSDLLMKIYADTLQDIVNKTSQVVGDVSVVIPKFTVDQALELTPILEAVGVGDLFSSSADLSTLTGSKGLQLDAAIHKARITVDETGSEAAAATAIFANRFAADSFVANHPFVYLLFDKTSNILLFTGIFNSPET